jgi:hypothetical protein
MEAESGKQDVAFTEIGMHHLIRSLKKFEYVSENQKMLEIV